MEHVVHELQPFVPVKNVCSYTELFEIVQKIVLYMIESRLCLLHGISFDSKGQILSLCKAVVSLCKLGFEHL